MARFVHCGEGQPAAASGPSRDLAVNKPVPQRRIPVHVLSGPLELERHALVSDLYMSRYQKSDARTREGVPSCKPSRTRLRR